MNTLIQMWIPVLSLLSDCLWPAVAVFALFLFRRELSSLVQRVTELNVLGNKANFLDVFRKATEESRLSVRNITPPLQTPPQLVPQKKSELLPKEESKETPTTMSLDDVVNIFYRDDERQRLVNVTEGIDKEIRALGARMAIFDKIQDTKAIKTEVLILLIGKTKKYHSQ